MQIQHKCKYKTNTNTIQIQSRLQTIQLACKYKYKLKCIRIFIKQTYSFWIYVTSTDTGFVTGGMWLGLVLAGTVTGILSSNWLVSYCYWWYVAGTGTNLYWYWQVPILLLLVCGYKAGHRSAQGRVMLVKWIHKWVSHLIHDHQ